MITAVLLDLDDTLLQTNLPVFMDAYFAALADYAAPRLNRDRFIPELLRGTRAMMDAPGQVSNRERFWAAFETASGWSAAEMEPFFDRFYRDRFPALRTITRPKPAAARLVRWALDAGLKVVVATNPVYPRTAVEQRLDWAGLNVAHFDFDLVTSYENMRATKPHVAYYKEILAAIDRAPGEALMAGDTWSHDIEPAAALGLRTYWVSANGAAPPAAEVVDGWGTLADLAERLRTGWLRPNG